MIPAEMASREASIRRWERDVAQHIQDAVDAYSTCQVLVSEISDLSEKRLHVTIFFVDPPRSVETLHRIHNDVHEAIAQMYADPPCVSLFTR